MRAEELKVQLRVPAQQSCQGSDMPCSAVLSREPVSLQAAQCPGADVSPPCSTSLGLCDSSERAGPARARLSSGHGAGAVPTCRRLPVEVKKE